MEKNNIIEFEETKIDSVKSPLQEVIIKNKRKEVQDFLKSKLLGKEQEFLSEVEELIWSLNLSKIQSHGNLKKKTRDAISSAYGNYFKSSNDAQKTFEQVLIAELHDHLHILAQELRLSNEKESRLQDSLLTLKFNNLPSFLNKRQLKSVDIFLKGVLGIDPLHQMVEELFSTLDPDILSYKEILTSMILNLETDKISMFDELTGNDCNTILKFIDDNKTLISSKQPNRSIEEEISALISTLDEDVHTFRDQIQNLILQGDIEGLRNFEEFTGNDLKKVEEFFENFEDQINDHSKRLKEEIEAVKEAKIEKVEEISLVLIQPPLIDQGNQRVEFEEVKKDEVPQQKSSQNEQAEKDIARIANQIIDNPNSEVNYQPEHSHIQPIINASEERPAPSGQSEERKNQKENDQIQRQLNQKFANDYSHFKARYINIGNESKYDLSDFVNIEKYAIMEESATRDVYAELNRFFSRNSVDYSKRLYELIFYYLKRQQSLEKFTREVRQIDNGVTLKMILAGLFLNCTEELVFRLTQNLWTQNPVPLITHDISENEPIQQFLPIFYYNFLIEETDKWVFSFGLGKAKGKSTFLNKIFYTNFEISNRGDKALFFNGTVDFQGDKNFASTSKRGFSLLDAHGNVEQHLIHSCIDLADFVLIHVVLAEANTFGSHIESLKKYFPRKRFLIILRDFDLDIYLSFADSCKTEAIRFKLKEEISGIPNIDLIVVPRTSENFGDYENCIRSRILTIISEIQYQSKQEKLEEKCLSAGYVSKKLELSTELSRLLKTSYKSKSRIFSIYDDFHDWAKSRLNKDDDPHKLMKSQELQNEYRKKAKTLGTLLQIWYRLMKSTDFIFEYSLINRSITLESSKACIDLNREKNEVFKQYQDLLTLPNKNENENNELKIKKEIIDDLLLKLDSKALSIEMIWREVALYVENNDNAQEKEFVVQYRNSIIRGEPFEILNGDQNYMLVEFLKKVVECDKFFQKRILVISIIGPQNSGKSTLLNFLFGCLFNVSDGRCTRGVYGTLLKSSLPEYEYFLIIDSEGIQSIEKGDAEYDRKIILFCLAVSNIVIINVKDQITDTMKSMLEVCANALGQIKVNKMPLPSVYFVLNQKANPNVKNFENDLNKIIGDLTQNELHNVINLASDNFVALPSAFTQNHTKIYIAGDSQLEIPWRHFGTSSDFIEKVSNFGSKLLNSLQSDKFKNSPIKDLPSFIETAESVYITINKNADIANFNSIRELKMQKQIEVWINDNLKKTFSEEIQAKKLKELNSCSSIQRESILEEFLKAGSDTLTKKLESELKKKDFPQHLSLKNESNLAAQLANIKNDWKKKVELLNFRKQIQNATKNPHEALITIIRQYLNSGKRLSEKEAKDEFQMHWDKILMEINDKFDTKKIEDQCSKIIHKLYLQLETTLDKSIIQAMKKDNLDARHSNLLCQIRQNDYEKNNQILSQNGFPKYNYLDDRRLLQHRNNIWAKVNAANYILKDSSTSFHEKKKDLLRIGCSLIEASQRQGYHHSFRSNESYTYKDVKIVDPDLDANIANKSSAWESFKGFFGFYSHNQKENLTMQASIYHFRQYLEGKLVDYLNFERLKEDIKSIVKDKVPASIGPLTTETISGLIGAIREGVIDECNAELEVFGQNLSFICVQKIHNFAFSHLVEHEKKLMLSDVAEMRKILGQEEEKNRLMFINMLIVNSSDEILAELVVNHYYNFLHQHYFELAKTKLENDILNLQTQLSRSFVQTEFEQQLKEKSPEIQIKYLMEPDKLFKGIVEERWNEEKVQITNSINTEFQKGLSTFNDLKTILDHIQNKIRALGLPNYESLDIFECKSFDTPDGSSEGFAHGQAAFDFFFNLILGRPNEQIRIEKSNFIPKFQTPSLICTLNTLNMKLLDQVFGKIKGSKIRNLKTFLESLGEKFDQKKKVFQSHQLSLNELDEKKLIPNMEKRSSGCDKICPCCNRLCDIEHYNIQGVVPGEGPSLHKCTRGHQIRAIRGITIAHTDEASVKFCENTQDEERIIDRGIKMKWSEFKKKHPQWDWRFDDLDKSKIDDLHNKILTCWLRVGKEICNIYNKMGNPMKYVEQNKFETRTPIHFIFALDGSGSMHGNPWNTLIESVKLFCTTLKDCDDDFCTIIIFESTAKVFCEKTSVDKVDLSNIKFPSGNTNFTKVFEKMHEIMDRNSGNQEEFFIIFMTDGNAEYPEAPLKKIKEDFWNIEQKERKLKDVKLIGFGKVPPVLTSIGQSLGVGVLEALDAQALLDTYVSIAEKIV